MTKTYRFDFGSPLGVSRITRIREILSAAPTSRVDLCEALGVGESTLHEYIKFLRGKQIHIGEWRKDHNRFTPLWVWGPGRNARQPVWVKAPKPVYVKKVRRPKPPKPAPARVRPKVMPRPAWRHPMDVMLYGEARA